MAGFIRQRWLNIRNRLLSSPRFQHWAVRFYPTRFIARRRTRALFDLCAGFVYSQVLFACVQLRVFELLADGPRERSALAEAMGLDEPGAVRLLEAATALELVERLGSRRYALGTLGAAAMGNPAVAAMVAHHDRLYADLADPVALLRGHNHDDNRQATLASYWGYAGHDRPAMLEASRVDDYSELMARSQAMIADQVLDAYPLAAHARLLDIGGGDGVFAIAAARRAPGLQVCVFDLPAVAERARRRVEAEGLAERIDVRGGDFRRDPMPAGVDLVTLVRIIHDHEDATVLALLRVARAALAEGGRLLIAEPMADTRGAQRIGAAYFGFYLLAMGQGRPRTSAEHAALLRAAGFDRVRFLRVANPLLVRVVVAQ